MTKDNEKDLAAYAESVEGGKTPNSIEMPATSAIDSGDAHASLVEQAKKQQAEYKAKSLEELHEEHAHEIRQDAINSGLTLSEVPIAGLPSKGLFYPVGTRIFIQPVRTNDIKRWTAMDETSVQDINNKIIDILQSCCKISFGREYPVRATYQDLLDVDRLYLLFAIHDYSFRDGDNDIAIQVDEKTTVPLRKENVKFIEFGEKFMKFYNPDKRCFSFPVKNKKAFEKTNGMMDIYMPTMGVAQFLTDYMNACDQRQENYDQDMIIYANMLIKDWRGLTRDKYIELVESTADWGRYEWSLISKIKDIILTSSQNPVMTYTDAGGVERETTISFRNGFKGIFADNLDIDL